MTFRQVTNHSIERLSAFIIENPIKTLIFSLLITAIAALGNPYYQNTLDYRFFFSEDNPQLLAFEKLQKDYTKTEAVYIALEAKDGDVFTSKNLSAIEALTTKSWRVPYALRVDSLTNFQRSLADGDSIEVADLFSDSLQLHETEIATNKKYALQEPVLLNALISETGDVTGIRITMNLPGKNLEKETPEVVSYIRKMAADFELNNPQFNVYLTGQVVVDQAFPEATEEDFGFVWPAFFVVMLVLLLVIFRSVTFMLLTIITGILSIAGGLGAIGWTHLEVNAAITVAPIMILTLAIADGIHIISGYRQALLKHNHKNQALLESLKINMMPVFLTSLMTILGFLTLHFNDSPPYRALGYIVASGVGFALFLSVFFMVPLVAILPNRITLRPAANNSDGMMTYLAEFTLRNRRLLPLSMLFLAMLIMTGLYRNTINDDTTKYFGENQKMRQHLEFVNTRVTGIGALNFSLNSGKQDGITDLEYLKRVEAYTDWLKKQPDVVQVDSLVDIIKRLNRSWHEDNQDYYRLPDTTEEASQYLLAYELSLPLGMDTNNIVTFDKSSSRVRVAIRNTNGRALIHLNATAEQWLKDNAPEHMWATGASAPLMFAYIGERSIYGILTGLIGSLFIMALILSVLFKSMKLGAVSLVSNILPIAMAFGVWGFLNGRIDLGLTVTLGIAFGIVVDDTIHFISKYQWARKSLGLSPDDAIRYTFKTVGRALWITTVVLCAGFSMLAASDMNITANTAFITTTTIGFAFMIDFFFIPGLLLMIDRPVTSGKNKKRYI